MKSSLLAIRSIGAALANRLFYPMLAMGCAGTIIVVALIAWLATVNEWWWLLAVPVLIVVCVGIGVLTVTKLVIKSVTPPQSTVQKKASRQFVDKLLRLSETAQTPKFILFFRVIRDVAAPTENGFIGTLSHDTASLRRDFTELRELFAND